MIKLTNESLDRVRYTRFPREDGECLQYFLDVLNHRNGPTAKLIRYAERLSELARHELNGFKSWNRAEKRWFARWTPTDEERVEKEREQIEAAVRKLLAVQFQHYRTDYKLDFPREATGYSIVLHARRKDGSWYEYFFYA